MLAEVTVTIIHYYYGPHANVEPESAHTMPNREPPRGTGMAYTPPGKLPSKDPPSLSLMVQPAFIYEFIAELGPSLANQQSHSFQ